MSVASIGGRPVGPLPFVIAEAGVNHEGSLDRAIEMVDAAAASGADAIKFQSYKADTLASKDSPAYWDQSKEPADSQYALFQRYDSFGVEEYGKLAARCKEKNVLFMTTPFDATFVEELDALQPCYKIASADITNIPLLRQIGAKGKPVLLSTGASYLGEIETAVRELEGAGASEIGILHCILEYPTAPEHSNLRSLRALRAAFPGATLGWSDHVPPLDGCLSMLLAWLEGAVILEKHFTLDKTLPGNDHYHAMDPNDLRAFRERVDLTVSMLGVERKTVFDWEAPARLHARRSLVAAQAISAGQRISEAMLIPKRPGHGIAPEHVDLIVGRSPIRDIAEDEVLTWEAFMAGTNG